MDVNDTHSPNAQWLEETFRMKAALRLHDYFDSPKAVIATNELAESNESSSQACRTLERSIASSI